MRGLSAPNNSERTDGVDGPIEFYLSTTSLYSGDRVAIHGRSARGAREVSVGLVRKGIPDTVVYTGVLTVYDAATANDAYATGCGWPTVLQLTVLPEWGTGVFVFQFLHQGEKLTPCTVIVKPSPRILVVFPITTFQAYNAWSNKCFYDFPPPSGAPPGTPPVEFSPRLTFDRPGIWDGDGWESLISWLLRNARHVDFATSVDVHNDPSLLARYRLLVSVWHDEYWSLEMRQNVRQFLMNGGNIAFFSANTCWWQIRFEDADKTIVCYKVNALGPQGQGDPGAPSPDRVTGLWFADPPGLPEETLTGVSSRFAGMAGGPTMEGFRVRTGHHWVFAGTGLDTGDRFGQDLSIVGYECDGADLAGHMEVLYREEYADHRELDGWLETEDLHLVGDFMGAGHDQVLFINRTPGGNRVLIADFSQGPPVRPLYLEVWGQHGELDGWHDPEDLQFVGDFMGAGHDQVLFINRTSGGNRVLVADFSQGPPVRPLYLEAWGQHGELDGWHDPEDLQFVGDFMGVGHDQVLFINRTPGGNRILIADFSQGAPVRPLYLEVWGQHSWLDGWDSPAHVSLVGDFLGLGHAQLLFIRRIKTQERAMIVEFIGGQPNLKTFADDTLLDGWVDVDDLAAAGRFRGKPFDQVLFVNREQSGGRAMVVYFYSKPWGQQAAIHYWEDWGDSALLDGWHDPGDLLLVGDFMRRGYEQAMFINRSGTGGRVLVVVPHKDIEVPPRIKNPAQQEMIVLATADLWDPSWDSYDRRFPIGTATMGILPVGHFSADDMRGKVFTCGSTGWLSGLRERSEWNAVSQITLNVLRRLGGLDND
jgi:hypothetical protein